MRLIIYSVMNHSLNLPMKIEALFFASCRDIVGTRQMEIDIEVGARVRELRSELLGHYPRLAALDNVLSIAVNSEYVDDSALLKPGDQVAFIPPVSGG